MKINFLHKISIFFFLICPLYGQAQLGDNLIFSFDQFYKNTYSYCPSLLDTSFRVNATLGSRNYSGVFGGIKSNFINLNYLIKNKSNRFHSFGVQLVQNNMGDYIRFNKGFVNYNFRLPINQDFDFTAGANFGMKSLFLDPSDVGGGGTSSILTSSLGLGLASKKFTILCGYQDFLNKNYLFEDEEVKSPIIYNAYVNFLQDINYQFLVNLYLLAQLNNLGEKNINAASVFQLYNAFDFGAGVRTDKGVFVLLGFSNLDWQSISSDIQLSYLAVPFFKQQSIPNQVVELTLSMKYKK